MKERICLTIETDLLKWLDERVEQRSFANRSHALELITRRQRENEAQR